MKGSVSFAFIAFHLSLSPNALAAGWTLSSKSQAFLDGAKGQRSAEANLEIQDFLKSGRTFDEKAATAQSIEGKGVSLGQVSLDADQKSSVVRQIWARPDGSVVIQKFKVPANQKPNDIQISPALNEYKEPRLELRRSLDVGLAGKANERRVYSVRQIGDRNLRVLEKYSGNYGNASVSQYDSKFAAISVDVENMRQVPGKFHFELDKAKIPGVVVDASVGWGLEMIVYDPAKDSFTRVNAFAEDHGAKRDFDYRTVERHPLSDVEVKKLQLFAESKTITGRQAVPAGHGAPAGLNVDTEQ